MKPVQIVPQQHDLIWGIKGSIFPIIFIGVPTYMLWYYPIIKTFSITTSKYKTNHKTYKNPSLNTPFVIENIRLD